jgi:bacterioferritin-associated ferredoxin
MYVCVCNAVNDREIRAAVALGARTLDDLRESLGVASCCKRCTQCAQEVLGCALASEAACAGAD